MKKLKKVFSTKEPVFAIFAIAVLAGTVVCAEAWRLSRPTERLNEPRYLVAARDLEAGQPLGLPDFTIATRTQLHGSIPPGALTDQEVEWVKEATLEIPMMAGQVLMASALRAPGSRVFRSSSIPDGTLAYPIHPANSLPVSEGDSVDVSLVPEGPGAYPSLLLESLRVLQVTPPVEGDEASLVVAVDRQDLELLEKAEQKGKLKIALRSPRDRSKGVRSKRPWRASRPKPPIEILSEEE